MDQEAFEKQSNLLPVILEMKNQEMITVPPVFVHEVIEKCLCYRRIIECKIGFVTAGYVYGLLSALWMFMGGGRLSSFFSYGMALQPYIFLITGIGFMVIGIILSEKYFFYVKTMHYILMLWLLALIVIGTVRGMAHSSFSTLQGMLILIDSTVLCGGYLLMLLHRCRLPSGRRWLNSDEIYA